MLKEKTLDHGPRTKHFLGRFRRGDVYSVFTVMWEFQPFFITLLGRFVQLLGFYSFVIFSCLLILKIHFKYGFEFLARLGIISGFLVEVCCEPVVFFLLWLEPDQVLEFMQGRLFVSKFGCRLKKIFVHVARIRVLLGYPVEVGLHAFVVLLVFIILVHRVHICRILWLELCKFLADLDLAFIVSELLKDNEKLFSGFNIVGVQGSNCLQMCLSPVILFLIHAKHCGIEQIFAVIRLDLEKFFVVSDLPVLIVQFLKDGDKADKSFLVARVFLND